jgi:phage terminase large subunit-like protein
VPIYDEDDEEFLDVDAAPSVSFTDLLAEAEPVAEEYHERYAPATLAEFFEQREPTGISLTADDHVAIVDEIRERRGPLPPPLPQTAQALPPPPPPDAEPLFTPQPDLPPAAVAVLIDDDDEPGFANAVAEALERLAPHSGQALASHQIPPPEHNDPESTVTGWVMLAGRNAGKTYAGARWLDRFMRERPKLRARIIAPSFGDAVASCIEGPSGILAASNYSVQWKPAHPGGAQLVWPNGSVCYVIGTPTPRDVDRLRAIGNVDADWYEEAAANPQIEEAERQARLSRRRKGAKWIATTTPRPIKTIRDWKKDPAIAISAATAHDNKHADPVWLEELERMYAGTRLYAQEVEGKVLEDVEGALWKLGDLERSRISDLVAFHESLDARGASITQAAVGVDPANSTGTTGIVLSVITDDRHLYVLEDASEPGRSSEQWARAAVNLARLWDAVIVPENDSGGDAIRGVLKAADLMDDITIVPATARGRGGKAARAEPIALLWERDDFRGHIVGTMPKLEDQLTSYVEGITKESPDRMDAMVWGCTFLWARASFNDVTTQFPSHMQAPGRASSRRPGAMIRWHKGKVKR